MNRALLACVLLTACSGVRLAGAPSRACAGGAPLVVSTAPKWAAQGVMLLTAPSLVDPASRAASTWNASPVGQPRVDVVEHAALGEVDGTVTSRVFATDDFAGLTSLRYDHETIVGADVEVNERDPIALVDPRAVLTHEFGHVLGLPHSTDVASVMHCDAPRRGTTELTPDDVATLSNLYGGR